MNNTATVTQAAGWRAQVTFDLTKYKVILVNTSAGKDSLAMLDYVYSLAQAQGVTDRIVAVHCDLGAMEWQGTRELAETQCRKYGVPLHVISRAQDLLSQVSVTVRPSALNFRDHAPIVPGLHAGSAADDRDIFRAFQCPARSKYGNTCGPCRTCWDAKDTPVSYGKH